MSRTSIANPQTSRERLCTAVLNFVELLFTGAYAVVAVAFLYVVYFFLSNLAALPAARYSLEFLADAARPFVAFVAEVGDALAAIDPVVPSLAIALAGIVLLRPLQWLVDATLVRIGLWQDRLQSLISGDVDNAFRRVPQVEARRRAFDRREAINKFVTAHEVPSTKSETRYSVTLASTIREYVERRQEVDDSEPLRVAEFIERPPRSPISLESSYVEGIDEIAGQFVRLNFERTQPQQQACWARFWGILSQQPPEDIIVPLLQRVVDAAILADRHFDALRDTKGWKGMPFFECIYAEWRPIPRLLHILVRPLVGNAMPARVVIETHYPDVFRNALFGESRQHRRTYRNWFGIGIKIEKPSPRVSRRAWWAQPEVLCRRLKSHIAGSMSQRFRVSSVGNSLGLPANFRIMPGGPLADGCPSVVTPHLLSRGAVSQAPAAWLFQAEAKRPAKSAHLATDCQGFCIKNLPKDNRAPAEMVIDAATFGRASTAAADLRKRYWGPRRPWKIFPSLFRRRVWIGAMVDQALRQASRFPTYGCKARFSDTIVDTLRATSSDMNGTLVRPVRSPRDVLSDLSNVFASRWAAAEAPSQSKGFGGAIVSCLGPARAPHVLVPEPLLKDYLNHVAQIVRVVANLPAPENEPPLVPKPEKVKAR